MKKLVIASVVAAAGFGLAIAAQLKAQENITIKNPAEYNAYQVAMNMTDPKQQASAIEGFLTAYPQSVIKKAMLSQLIDDYKAANDPERILSATDRMLQVDPNNFDAIFTAVSLKKSQCAKTSDVQVCNDAAALAQRGLTAPKPADTPDDKWKQWTAAGYPAFHSAIALDYMVAKKDVKAAIEEYRKELMLYPTEQTSSGSALVDSLQLAEAYAKPDARDMVQAVWFYARVWNFAPAAYKAQIEPKMEYWYKRYHGKMDSGLDDIKAAAAKSLFKPEDVTIKPAPTPAEIAHEALTGSDPAKLNLEDKEYILANGAKEDVDKIWSLIKGQTTAVPGIVIEASTTVIKVAVTDTAKETKIADFIVNLKKPLDEKEVPAVGYEFKSLSAGTSELDATIDSFTEVPATATTAATAQIVAIDGFVQKVAAAKKPAAAAAHRKAR